MDKLKKEINEIGENDASSDERSFLENLRKRGLLAGEPRQLPDYQVRKNFKRIKIKGEPLSQTIIRERG